MAQPKMPIGGYNFEKKTDDSNQAENNKNKEPKINKQIKELSEYKAPHNINDDGSVTFYPTSDKILNRNGDKYCENRIKTDKIKMDYILGKQGCGEALAYSSPDDKIAQLDDNTSGFISCTLKAWSEHYPLRLKCEHLWLLILQGVAVHVDKNAEKLREKYVTHDGKMKLCVDISANPSTKEWETTIQNFVSQIDKNTVKDTCELFECDFTTSTITEKLAAKVTIMDICKNYFSYMCFTRCGFPEITLAGKKQDWEKLKAKTEQLLETKVDKQFGDEWGKALIPVLDRFIDAFDGKIDAVFWNSMIKRGATGGSGGYSWYSGWFNILFPFLTDKKNPMCVPYSDKHSYVQSGFVKRGIGYGENKQTDYPIGLSSAPVTWNKMGQMIEMKFLAGFVGFTSTEIERKQDEKDKETIKTYELCPNVAWCVATEKKDKKKEDENDE